MHLLLLSFQDNDAVIEDIKIHEQTDPLIVHGYKLLTVTKEGEELLNNKFFLIKKVKRNKAKEIITDITAYPDKNSQSVPETYTKLKLVSTKHFLFIHSFIPSFIHSFLHSFIHSFVH